MANNKKVTITISLEALEKLELQANLLDISVNTYIKQIAMNYITNNKLVFFSPEQKIVLQRFADSQNKLINILNLIAEQYKKNNQHFPIAKIQKYLKSYHKNFHQTIERLQNDN